MNNNIQHNQTIPEYTAVASRGKLSNDTVLPLVSKTELKDRDNDILAQAISACSDLEPGQEAIISISFEKDNSLKGQGDKWIKSYKGEDIKPSRSSVFSPVIIKVITKMFWGIISFITLIGREIANTNKSRKQTNGKNSKQQKQNSIPISQLTEKQKINIDGVKNKMEKLEHFNTVFDIVVWSKNKNIDLIKKYNKLSIEQDNLKKELNDLRTQKIINKAKTIKGKTSINKENTSGDIKELSVKLKANKKELKELKNTIKENDITYILDRVKQGIINGFAAVKSVTYEQSIWWDKSLPIKSLLGHISLIESNDTILTASEIASIAHPPDDNSYVHGVIVDKSSMKMILPKKIPVVNSLDDLYFDSQFIIPFVALPGVDKEFQYAGGTSADQDKHMAIFGTTGSGKSVAMETAITMGAKDPARRCIAVLDPHGQLIDNILPQLIERVPERVKDIVVIELTDKNFPVAINPLDINTTDRLEQENIVNGIINMFINQMGANPETYTRALPYMKAVVAALVEANAHLPKSEKLTLLQTTTFLRDEEFRDMVVSLCASELVHEYFGENGYYTKAKNQDEISTVPVRIFNNLKSETFSNVFGSSKDKLNIDKLVRERKIILLSSGGISGNTSSRQFGEFCCQMVIPQIIAAAKAYGRIKDRQNSEEYVGMRIFIDEAPRVVAPISSEIEAVMAEMRKRDCGIFLAAQFLSQYTTSLQEAIMQNTASKLVFRTDMTQAKKLAQSISPKREITEVDIADLPKRYLYGDVAINGGENTKLFSGGNIWLGEIKKTKELKNTENDIINLSREFVSNTHDFMLKSRETQLLRQMHAMEAYLTKGAINDKGPLFNDTTVSLPEINIEQDNQHIEIEDKYIPEIDIINDENIKEHKIVNDTSLNPEDEDFINEISLTKKIQEETEDYYPEHQNIYDENINSDPWADEETEETDIKDKKIENKTSDDFFDFLD